MNIWVRCVYITSRVSCVMCVQNEKEKLLVVGVLLLLIRIVFSIAEEKQPPPQAQQASRAVSKKQKNIFFELHVIFSRNYHSEIFVFGRFWTKIRICTIPFKTIEARTGAIIPKDWNHLAHFVHKCISRRYQIILKKIGNIKYEIIGAGSNILVRDKGYNGIIFKLGKNFNRIVLHKTLIEVGAGILDVNLAKFTQLNKIANFEFYSGIPGSIGGAIKMNAGCYGLETKDILNSIKIIEHLI